ncbi:hypothetical protein L798_10774 [Zootermopsis nevadensis]|uniref:Uncharacterized protein n=1 Tax=Zootermopsis nevadensis TaxID=136037 RepID=A0A067R5P6_ZOONE|nr:hypothetical protein L798_10774 [Zootermopsis nevadensis]
MWPVPEHSPGNPPHHTCSGSKYFFNQCDIRRVRTVARFLLEDGVMTTVGKLLTK